ncbi:MAG: hypothetical protein F8N36_14335 [Desulfovibrio sp.]|uniref:DUF6932 family protein n=1 Tax=Desulfovibrio sp. TaxID=885 RepID=UPI00135E14FC|nr:hypothetical protein [Desulfovibrio sp.]MTJ94016.1 hypothetical protein [Desulfovibrio sp.]
MPIPNAKTSITEFRRRYGTTERRRYLLAALDREIANLLSFGTRIQIFVFGSFLTKKPEPGDIDLLVRGHANTPFAPYNSVCPGDIQVKSSFSVMGSRSYSRSEIVEKFNGDHKNVKNGIFINEDGVTELILEAAEDTAAPQ